MLRPSLNSFLMTLFLYCPFVSRISDFKISDFGLSRQLYRNLKGPQALKFKNDEESDKNNNNKNKTNNHNNKNCCVILGYLCS